MDQVTPEAFDVTADSTYSILWSRIHRGSIALMVREARAIVLEIAMMRGAPVMSAPLNFLRSTLKTHTCQSSWITPTLSFRCRECARSPNSVICFSCFLAGHHDTHRVCAHYSHNGNCDCGDEQIWEPLGFCPRHPGASANPDQDELTVGERQTFRAICRVMIE
jgi:hypothetical protein